MAAVIATDGLGTWAVSQRLQTGVQREADTQAQAQLLEARALYSERAATLAAEGEAVALYPAVIAALVDSNPKPLLQWSGEMNALQGLRVTVTDVNGRVVARGHAPDQAGDELASQLSGLGLALEGQKVSGTEAGDEIGLAVRGYAPVRRNGVDGPVVGAVMIADPLGGPLLQRFVAPRGGAEPGVQAETQIPGVGPDGCRASELSTGATCQFTLLAPDGRPSATLSFVVPLADIERARDEAQRALWVVGSLVLVFGAVAAWLLARSFTRPLAQLTAAAGGIALGGYDRPVDVKSTDEIGVLASALETMRQRVAASTTQLRDERDVLNSVLDSTADGILMTDPSGQPVVANRRWRDLLGADGFAAAAAFRELDGSHQRSLADAAHEWLAGARRLATAEFDRTEPAYQRLRCYTAPVSKDDGTLIGRIFVMRDVTRESEAERMRNAFVATVSHELRSPLTVISGYTDTLLRSGPWDETTQHDFLEIVARSAATLAGLVDNLLDAAMVEAGVLHIECEPVHLQRIAEQVIAQRKPLASQHTLVLVVQPELPLAEADPLRAEQVLINLVDNAIKYSPDGGTITVRLSTASESLMVSVEDEGVGVSPEQAERLFDRFYRANGTLERTTKGVGLGLFICRALVEAQGGRIWVESQPGRGSTFHFTLPVLVQNADVCNQSQQVIA
jgi:signal transduction histidine kinase